VAGCNWYNPGVWWQPGAGVITDPSGTYANLEWQNGQENANSTNISTTSPDGTTYSHAWTFGYFEVRMKFNPTTGSAPAIWMFAEQGITGGPNSISGELDLFEWQSQTPTTFYGTAHVWQSGTNIGGNGTTDAWPVPAGTNFNDYNTYGVLWTPTSISWYLNNVLMETIDTTSAPYSTAYGGSESYFLILSQQAGCNWVGTCPGQVSPLNMQVQWVHVYAPPAK
jgi:beta-glucanase (GH16 family)